MVFFPQPFCAVGSTAKVGFGSIRSAASSTCRIPGQGTVFIFIFRKKGHLVVWKLRYYLVNTSSLSRDSEWESWSKYQCQMRLCSRRFPTDPILQRLGIDQTQWYHRSNMYMCIVYMCMYMCMWMCMCMCIWMCMCMCMCVYLYLCMCICTCICVCVCVCVYVCMCICRCVCVCVCAYLMCISDVLCMCACVYV